jgi:hypothetical protein
MNPSDASSQTPNNIRKKVGPAVWLLALLWDSMPADWTGDTFLSVASGNVISDAEFAERLEVSQRTIAKWRSRLPAAGVIGWLVARGQGRGVLDRRRESGKGWRVEVVEQKPALTMPAASRWLQ